MKKYIILFFINLTLFANEAKLLDLEKEKESLIASYFERIEKALDERLSDRALLLDETLICFKNSMSSRDIENCKIDERKRIMALLK